VESYFREINWLQIFKGALNELQQLVTSGQVSVGSKVSWWAPMPAIIRINVPVLGFLDHTVQEALLEKCEVIVTGKLCVFAVCCVYLLCAVCVLCAVCMRVCVCVFVCCVCCVCWVCWV
jgi:hypothetical protein